MSDFDSSRSYGDCTKEIKKGSPSLLKTTKLSNIWTSRNISAESTFNESTHMASVPIWCRELGDCQADGPGKCFDQ